MNILMLSATFPYPPTHGGTQVRTFNLLKQLQQRHSVTLLTLRSPDVTDAEVANLRQQVNELIVFPRPLDGKTGTLAKLKRFANFANGLPQRWAECRRSQN